MNNQKWNSVLMEWVNCLKLGKNVHNVDELRNGEFFANLQKVVTKSRISQSDTLTFIFDLLGTHYPNYSFENKTEIHLSDLPELALRAITSLLMHYTCIYDRKDVLTSPLCHSLSQSTQLIVRNFLQKITKDVTNDSMENIIKICIDDAFDHSTNHQWLSNGSGRNSPLQDFLKTPVSKFGRLHEKDKIISKLRSELETERYDKLELQQDLNVQIEKNKKCEQQLSQKTNEITRLRGEVAALENRTPPHYQDMDSRELQRRLRSEIQSLEQYIKQTEDEQETIRKERDTAKETLRKFKCQSGIWEEKFFETERNLEVLKEHSAKRDTELVQLQEHCAEITALLEEYRSKSSHDSSLYDTFVSVSDGKCLIETPSCEDLACSVIEVQLRDAQKQIEELKLEVAQQEGLEETLKETEERLKKCEDRNEEFTVQVSSMQALMDNIERRFSEAELKVKDDEETIREQTIQIEELVSSLKENSETLKNLNSENGELSSKVTSLQSSNEQLEKRLADTSDDLQSEKRRSEALETELDDMRKVSEKLQFELADVILDNQKFNSQVETLRIERDSLLENLTRMEHTRQMLEAHLLDSRRCLDDSKMEHEELQRKCDLLTEEYSAHEAQFEREKSELSHKLKESVEKTTTVETTNGQLKFQIGDLENRMSEVTDCLESSRRRTEELERELDEVQKSYRQLTIAQEEIGREKENLAGLLEEKRKTLSSLEQEKSELSSLLNNSEELRQVTAKNNDELSVKNQELESELSSMVDRLERSEDVLEKLSENCKCLEKELDEARLEIRRLEVVEDELKRSHEASQRENDELMLVMKNLREELSDVQKELKVIIGDAQSMEDAWKEDRRSVETLRNTVQEMETEKWNLVEELAKSNEILEELRQEKMVVESELEACKRKCDSLERAYNEEVSDLGQKLKGATEELENNKKRFDELRNSKVEIELKLDETLGDLESVKNHLKEVQIEKISLEGVSESLKCEIEEIQGECGRNAAESVRLEKEMALIERRLQELKTVNDTLEAMLGEKTHEIENLQQDNSLNLESIGKYAIELEEERLKIRKLETENDELNVIITDYQRKDEQYHELIDNVNSSVDILQQKLEESYDSLEQHQCNELKLNKQLENLENKNQILVEKLEDCEMKLTKTEEQVSDLTMRNEEIRNERAELAEELETKKRELLAQTEEYEKQKTLSEKVSLDREVVQKEKDFLALLLQEKETNNDEQVKNLREQLQGVVCENAKLEECVAELKDTETQNDNLRKQISQMVTEKDELDSRIVGCCKKIDDLQLQNDDLRSQLCVLEADYKQMKSNKETVERQLNEVSVLSQTLTNEAEDIRVQYQTCKVDLDETRDALARLMKEKDDMGTALKATKDALQEDLEMVKGRLEVAQNEKAGAERENKMLISRNQELEVRLIDTETSKEATAKMLNGTRDALEKLTKERDDLGIMVKEANAVQGEIEKHFEVVKQELEETRNEKATLENERKMLISRSEELERRLAETEEMYESSKAETKEREDVATALAEAKDELQKNLELIRVNLEDALTEKVTFERENKTLTSRNQELEVRLTDSEKSKEATTEILNETRDALEKSTKEKDDTLVALLEANETKDKLQKNSELIEAKLEEIQKEMSRAERENEMLICKNEEERKTEMDKLISSNVCYKNEIEDITRRAQKAEQDLEVATRELLVLQNQLEREAHENSILNKKIEVEEIISSENKERAKCLEETIQDYEITISGLKSVVDTNLERLEGLKQEVDERRRQEIETMKLVTDLLENANLKCAQGDDFKSFIRENFVRLLKLKSDDERRMRDLESEIRDLKERISAAQGLNSSVQGLIEKLQILVSDKCEIASMETLRSSFDTIHTKVKNLLQTKQELSEDLQTIESEKCELSRQLEVLKVEKEEIARAKMEADNDLKAEREKLVSLRKEFENKTKPVKVEKENILGVSTRANKSREEELKRENMVLKRKVVLTENAKNNLEKILKELREEKKKVPTTQPLADDDALYKKLLQDYIQVKEENGRVVKEKDARIEELTRQTETLKSDNIKTEDDNRTLHDLQNIREAYGNLMSTNSKLELEMVTLRKIIEDRNSEMASMAHIKEAYERLLEENNKVLTEIDTVKYKRMRDKEEFVRLLKKEREDATNRETRKIQQVRGEYEGKLEKMKEKMLKLYRDEVNKKVKSVKDGQNETTQLLRTIANLKSELFEADQKIQLLEMEKEISRTNRRLDEVRSVPMTSITSLASNDERSVTLPRTSTVRDLVSQRVSIGRPPDAISTHDLHMEDEEDLFNDKYLTDLKEGRCTLPTTGRESTCRFSELAWRNSMVPPHLKSSYPAETQFVSPGRFKDDDIKTGNIEFEDSLCKLLPGEKPRKKDFGTTSYKRPGPPTPSKNGGRLSLQGNEIHPMREHCEAKTPKRSTPSRIRALFTGRNSSTLKDESQSNGTPSRGRRLNIFRRPK